MKKKRTRTTLKLNRETMGRLDRVAGGMTNTCITFDCVDTFSAAECFTHGEVGCGGGGGGSIPPTIVTCETQPRSVCNSCHTICG